MKSIFQSIFDNSRERIKNPFIGAFIISWLVINWRTILFIIFSSKNIEQKISHIESNYSNIWIILWWPAFFALFYTLLLPYINLGIDKILGYSIRKRNDELLKKEILLLNNRKEIAIEEIKLEEAKTEFRERKSHNELVDNLQKRIVEKDILLTNERERSEKILAETTKQLQNSQDKFDELSFATNKQIDAYNEENNLLKEAILDRDNKLKNITREQRRRDVDMEERFNKLQQENIHLSSELQDLKRELARSYNEINLSEEKQKIYGISNRNIK